MILRLPFLACTVAASLAAMASVAADIEAAEALHGGRSPSHWHFGPFFEWRRAYGEGADGAADLKETRSFWAFRPFYSQVRLAGPENGGEPAARTAVYDVLWPVGTGHLRANRTWWRALLAWGSVACDGVPRDGTSSFNIFPLWFSGVDRDGESYWAAFPLYGTHPHFMLMDDITFALWPLYMDYSVKDIRSRAVLWPLVSWKDAPREAFGLWPLFGMSRRRESRHGYALWPIMTVASYDEDRDTGGAGTSWMLWPLLGNVSRARETQWLFIPPFFSYAETPYTWRLRCPWPLLDIERGMPRNRLSVWPFWESIDGFSYGERKAEESTWRIGWKIVESTTLTTVRTREERFSVFPFWTWEKRFERGKDGAEQEVAAFCRVWPFWRSETQNGCTRRRVLDLIPIRHSEGLDRNWAPFWTFWSSESRPGGRTRHSLLWNLVTWHTEDD